MPLPAVPTSIQEGGAWTLQRLERETHPQPEFALDGAAAPTAAKGAQVILTQEMFTTTFRILESLDEHFYAQGLGGLPDHCESVWRHGIGGIYQYRGQ